MSSAATPAGNRRKPLVTILLVVPALVVAVTWMLLFEQLPETLATHWSGTMLPDGFSATTPTFITCLAISVFGAIIGLVGLRVSKTGWRAGMLFAGGLAGWTSAAGVCVSAFTTVLAGDPEQAVLGGWLVLLIIGSLMGITPYWLSGLNGELMRHSEYTRAVRLAKAHGHPLPEPLPVPETPFSKSVNAPAWVWIIALLTPVVVVLTMIPLREETSGFVISLVLLLAIIPLLLGMCRLKVQVDDRGLIVSSALLGFPMRKISLEDIESAETEPISPSQWGGWGWRFFPGGSALVFGAMDGLTVHTTGGKRFAVTMAGSEEVRDQLLARMNQRTTD